MPLSEKIFCRSLMSKQTINGIFSLVLYLQRLAISFQKYRLPGVSKKQYDFPPIVGLLQKQIMDCIYHYQGTYIFLSSQTIRDLDFADVWKELFNPVSLTVHLVPRFPMLDLTFLGTIVEGFAASTRH